MYQTLLNKEILILGCGNPLLGDDGFGPAVIERLEKVYSPEGSIGLLDAGTSIRDLLFDLLLSKKSPKSIYIIDAVDTPGKNPGDIFPVQVDQIPENKVSDYSLHQFPTTNMLKELTDSTRIDLYLWAVQIEKIPEYIKPGLSKKVGKAVPKMSSLIVQKINDMTASPCQSERLSC